MDSRKGIGGQDWGRGRPRAERVKDRPRLAHHRLVFRVSFAQFLEELLGGREDCTGFDGFFGAALGGSGGDGRDSGDVGTSTVGEESGDSAEKTDRSSAGFASVETKRVFMRSLESRWTGRSPGAAVALQTTAMTAVLVVERLAAGGTRDGLLVVGGVGHV